MKPSKILSLLWLVTLVFSSATWLNAASRIIVSATASPEFTQQNQDPDKIWYYQVAKGLRFSGGIRDKSLNEVKFEDMVTLIGNELTRENMYPHPDMAKGDFILVIHWGSTEVEEDLRDLFPGMFNDAGGGEDIDLVNMMNSWNVSTRSRNVALIGFDKAFNKKNLNKNTEYELRLALQDERYFMTVNAFDYPLFLSTGKAKLLWTTRFSTRSPGTNFEVAYEELIKTSVGYFGKNIEDLEKERADRPTSDVKFGKIEVIGEVEE